MLQPATYAEGGLESLWTPVMNFNISHCQLKCNLCSEVCPTKPVKALIMSEDYELGTYSRDSQILRVDEMYDGVPIEQYTR